MITQMGMTIHGTSGSRAARNIKTADIAAPMAAQRLAIFQKCAVTLHASRSQQEVCSTRSGTNHSRFSNPAAIAGVTWRVLCWRTKL
jgi:hypothetical protein